MARFNTKGLNELAESFKSLGEVVEPEFIDQLLDVGVEQVKDAWDMIIREEGYVDSGDMRESVDVSKKTKKGNVREIYPQGRDRKGVRNVEKAFYLHYGTSKILGSRFVDTVDKLAKAKSYIAMQDVFNNYLKSKGLI